MGKRVKEIPVLDLFSSRDWGRKSFAYRDCPPQAGLGRGNGGHSHHDQYSEHKVMEEMSMAASRLLDREVQSSCTLSPGNRWDWAGDTILCTLIWLDPSLVSPSGILTGPETQLSLHST